MHWYSKSSQNSSYKRQPSIIFGKQLDSGMDPWHFNLANSVFRASLQSVRLTYQHKRLRKRHEVCINTTTSS